MAIKSRFLFPEHIEIRIPLPEDWETQLNHDFNFCKQDPYYNYGVRIPDDKDIICYRKKDLICFYMTDRFTKPRYNHNWKVYPYFKGKLVATEDRHEIVGSIVLNETEFIFASVMITMVLTMSFFLINCWVSLLIGTFILLIELSHLSGARERAHFIIDHLRLSLHH